MLDSINKVAEFQKTTGSPVLPSPQVPDTKRIDLRVKLIQEELNELEQAAYKKEIVGVLDALCDLQYVLNGAILEFGLQDIFEESFNEVHRSNMSKFCETTQEAQISVRNYNYKQVEVYYQLVNKMHVIMRTSDDKILKGVRYSEPRLKKILDNVKQSKNEKNEAATENI